MADAPDTDSAVPVEPRPAKDALSRMSGKVLSGLLKERGLSSTGMKDALVNRLHSGWFEKK